MARTNLLPELMLSGRIGNLVFARSGEEVVVRTAQARRDKGSWSERQQQHRDRFKAAVAYYRSMRYRVVAPIWDLSATQRRTGYNLFMQANFPAFDSSGVLADYSLLHFSTGPLPLPQLLTAVREADPPRAIVISWNSEPVTLAEQPDDGLWYMLANNGTIIGPVATGAVRQEGQFVLDHPLLATGEPLHLYLFFGSKARTGYSEDRYFGV